ncbi:MAG TPA: restriction endonuclease subunit S [Longimicrobium sp.]|nr:restriction endonuclease subunit S [Longimicrobium sp.]
MSFTGSLSEIVEENRNGLLGVAPGWERVPLGRVASILNGFPFESRHFNRDAGLPLIRIRDVLAGETATLYAGEYEPSFLVDAGDLLIGMDGDFNCALWRGRRALLIQRVCRVDPEEEFYSRKFLSYVLPGYLGAINAHTSSVTVKHLSSRTVSEILLPLPPRREQDRIVAVIDAHVSRLDSAREGLRRVQRNLKRYRVVVLRAACEGRLVPAEAELAAQEGRDYESADVLLSRTLDERLGIEGRARDRGRPRRSISRLPEGWTGAVLADIAELKGGITKGQKRRPGDVTRLVPYLRVANVQRGYLNLSEVKEIEAKDSVIEELRLTPGDVLFNEGGDRDKLGRGWVWQGEIKECIHQNHVFRARVIAGVLHPKFLSWYGNSLAKEYFTEQGKQTTNLASISLTKLGALPVPIPPRAEQERIVAEVERRLSALDVLEAAVEKDLRRAERLRQSILKRAFEGKLVPQDPDDEPASALLERIRASGAEQKPSKPRRGRRTAGTAAD